MLKCILEVTEAEGEKTHTVYDYLSGVTERQSFASKVVSSLS